MDLGKKMTNPRRAKMHRFVLFRGLLMTGVVLLTVAGCGAGDSGQPATKKDLAERIPTLVATLINHSSDSFDAVRQSPSWDTLDQLVKDLGKEGMGGSQGLAALERPLRKIYIKHLIETSLG